MRLVKTASLTDDELKAVKDFVALAALEDGFESKFYWRTSEKRQNEEFSEFLFYLNDVLVGYLAIYQFSEGEAEICVLVAPEHRRKGLFQRLWVDATLELHQRNISSVVFLQHPDSEVGEACLKALEARYFRSEYRYERKTSIAYSPIEVTMRPASPDDLKAIARLDVACFGGDFAGMMSRLNDVFDDDARAIYLAEQDGKLVGKAHVLIHDDALIHDIAVMPKFQNQGFGSQLLAALTNLLLTEKDVSLVTVESTSDDYKANKLYIGLGFERTVVYRQWLYQLQENFEHYATLH